MLILPTRVVKANMQMSKGGELKPTIDQCEPVQSNNSERISDFVKQMCNLWGSLAMLQIINSMNNSVRNRINSSGQIGR